MGDRERGEKGEQEAIQSVAHSHGRLGNGKFRRGSTLEGARERRKEYSMWTKSEMTVIDAREGARERRNRRVAGGGEEADDDNGDEDGSSDCTLGGAVLLGGALLTGLAALATEALAEDAALEPEYVAFKRGLAGVVIMKSDPPEGTMVNLRLMKLV